MTPQAIHYGTATALQQHRMHTLQTAFLANPQRFKGNVPVPPALPTAAWINPPPKQAIAHQDTDALSFV
jgi:putative transposase